MHTQQENNLDNAVNTPVEDTSTDLKDPKPSPPSKPTLLKPLSISSESDEDPHLMSQNYINSLMTSTTTPATPPSPTVEHVQEEEEVDEGAEVDHSDVRDHHQVDVGEGEGDHEVKPGLIGNVEEVKESEEVQVSEIMNDQEVDVQQHDIEEPQQEVQHELNMQAEAELEPQDEGDLETPVDQEAEAEAELEPQDDEDLEIPVDQESEIITTQETGQKVETDQNVESIPVDSTQEIASPSDQVTLTENTNENVEEDTESLEAAYYIMYLIATKFNKAVFDESEPSSESGESEEEEIFETLKVTTAPTVTYPKKNRSSFVQKKRAIANPRVILRDFEKNDDDNIRAIKIDILEV